ncbi:Tyrosine ammonia-lyase [Massilia sp. Bi118]|uniref:aromatic amino acid lyase n=1 Tax=Massilia sp. Bi118 TaxID=2822346 RepID=UPI001DCD6256|nr:aromatic amino acid lyase [Massilia sp. Bi118]CAH0235552.1 Tyrosine ammonia-lyase [Massilia sp. Bi118]
MIMQIDLPAGGLPAVVFGAGPVTVGDIEALAAGRARPVLSGDPAFAARIEAGAARLKRPAGDDDAPHRLFSWHGAGLDTPFTPEQTRAILAVRLVALCQAESGAGMDTLRQLASLLEDDKLSALVAEDQALIDGGAAMTGLACLAAVRARSLCRLGGRIAALAAVALDGNASHFDQALFAARPYPGTLRAAGWIRDDLGEGTGAAQQHHLAPLRCAPQVIGVLLDGLPWMVSHIEVELNSAGGDPRSLDHAGHLTFAMEGMKNAVTKLAGLFEQQMALVVDACAGKGLPPGLRNAAAGHGLKALQASVSAWTAEALRLTPDAVIHKAGTGMIAARDCLRAVELTEQVAAALLVAVRQACALRHPDGLPRRLGAGLLDCMARIAELVPFAGAERRLDQDLRRLLAVIRYDGAALLCRARIDLS